MKIFTSLIFSLLLLSALCVSGKNYYITPKGTTTNDGSSFSKPIDLSKALGLAAAGDSLILEGGTYPIAYVVDTKNTIVLAQSGQRGKPIYVVSYQNSKAIIDFSFPAHLWVQNSFGLDITGSYWYFKGITITNAGYHGVYNKGTNNSFVNCVFSYNKFSGLEINKGGSNTSVINCDAFRNYDPKNLGGSADGFAPKQTMGTGNVLIGCRAYENSNDGYDTYDCQNPIVIENCWAFKNGRLTIGTTEYAGNKNGFKLGGLEQIQNNKVYNCVAFGHELKGFDENNNNGAITIYNCIGYKNTTNFSFSGSIASGQKHDFKNNISLSGTNADVIIGSVTHTNHTWNSGFGTSSNDFKSLDLTLAYADGSLPENDLFRLKSTSKLIDAGALTGRPYNGLKPDLGPFETKDLATYLQDLAKNDRNTLVFPTVFDTELNVRLLSTIDSPKVSIYSMQGALMHLETIDHSDKSIATVHMVAGKYIVKVENNGLSSSYVVMKL